MLVKVIYDIYKKIQNSKEQISCLEKRKLKFKNKVNAEIILKKYNYFDVVNGFESLLLKVSKSNKEYENIWFEDFEKLFFFDIESRLRTSIAYNFVETYCKDISDTMNYTNPKYYKRPNKNDTHLINVFNNFDLFRMKPYYHNGNIKKKSFINELKKEKQYVRQYCKPPFWVTIKALPLGSLYYTFIFLDDTVKEKVLKDFGMALVDVEAFEQALLVLKEMRNQCAHLELITRFKLKSKMNFKAVINRAECLSHSGIIFYIDVMKIFKLFGEIADIKYIIFKFYIWRKGIYLL